MPELWCLSVVPECWCLSGRARSPPPLQDDEESQPLINTTSKASLATTLSPSQVRCAVQGAQCAAPLPLTNEFFGGLKGGGVICRLMHALLASRQASPRSMLSCNALPPFWPPRRRAPAVPAAQSTRRPDSSVKRAESSSSLK